MFTVCVWGARFRDSGFGSYLPPGSKMERMDTESSPSSFHFAFLHCPSTRGKSWVCFL